MDSAYDSDICGFGICLEYIYMWVLQTLLMFVDYANVLIYVDSAYGFDISWIMHLFLVCMESAFVFSMCGVCICA